MFSPSTPMLHETYTKGHFDVGEETYSRSRSVYVSSEPIVPEVVDTLVKGSKQEEAEEIVELANKDEIS
ncbi:hypothetical protein IGI04_020550, partial [Brassica rapa subsp. trilocularis]